MLVDQRGQCLIKSLAAGKRLVVQHRGSNAVFSGKRQAFCFRLVADDRRNTRTVQMGPVVAQRSFYDGGHVGAAAGDQNDDVFHTG